jgi:hypothetical protein
MENNSLSHHGVKGQKWGIRRFQNKDGTLTPAGKKRYEAEVAKAKEGIRIQKNKARTQAKLDKLEALKRQARGETDDAKSVDEVKKKAKPEPAPKKKSASEMTAEELREAIVKAQLEDQYKALRPEAVPTGKAFAKKMFDEVVTPALVDAGKKQLTNMLNKIGDEALKSKPEVKSKMDKLKDEYNLLKIKKDIADLKDSPEISKLKDEYNLLKIKKDIDDLKNPKKHDDLPPIKTWDDATKKQTYEENLRKKAEAEAKEAAKKAEAETKAAKKAEAQKKVNEEYERYARGDYESGQYSKKGSEITDTRTDTRSTNNTSSDTINKSAVDSGKRVVAGLLSGPVSNPDHTYTDNGQRYTYELLDEFGAVILSDIR